MSAKKLTIPELRERPERFHGSAGPGAPGDRSRASSVAPANLLGLFDPSGPTDSVRFGPLSNQARQFGPKSPTGPAWIAPGPIDAKTLPQVHPDTRLHAQTPSHPVRALRRRPRPPRARSVRRGAPRPQSLALVSAGARVCYSSECFK